MTEKLNGFAMFYGMVSYFLSGMALVEAPLAGSIVK